MLYYLRKRALVLLLVIILFIIIMTLILQDQERKYLTVPEVIVIESFSFLQRSFHTGWTSGVNFFEDLWNFRSLREQNRQLETELRDIKVSMQQFEEIKKENERLREFFSFTPSLPENFLGARIVGYNPGSWLKTVTIDRGSSDGVINNMAVITSEGLAGRVLNVTYNSAQILLLNSSQSAVGALLQDSREQGIVKGIIEEPDYLKMENLRWDAEVEKGDKVISSGLGGIFPKGITIGTVVRIEQDELGLEKTAWIKPSVDFKSLEEVLIIKNS